MKIKEFILIIGLLSCLFFNTESLGQESKSLKLTKKGNNHFNKGRFDKAHQFYASALEADSSNFKASLYFGVGLLESEEKWRALPYILKAYLVDPEINDQIELYLGMAYQYNENFNKALHYFNKAKGSFRKYNKEERIEINLRIAQCKTAIELEKESPVYLVKNLGPSVNSSFSEYAPVLDPGQEKIIFSSNRIEKKKKGEYFTDIYSADKEEDELKTASKIKSTLNTKYDDMIMAIGDNGKQVLLYSYKNEGDIFISNLYQGEWSKPVTIGDNINTPEFFEGSACLSKDGNSLFFTSDRPGGYGGLDIYVSKKQENGIWGKPQNLGARINTKMNEESPSVSPDGKILFFSTEGHSGVGGFDVFYSLEEKDKDIWSNPVNMGLSVNTPEDDMNFTVSNDGAYAYFSTTRHDSYGAEDIYKVMLDKEDPGAETLLASLYPGNSNISHSPDNQIILTTNDQSSRPSSFEEHLLRNIYFPIDEKELDGMASGQLDFIADFMKSNKDFRLELAGHTDDTGSDEYNFKLSEERVESAFKYLISKGISAPRLILQAYGNKVPIATNDDELEGRELNRRVEINIISDFKPFNISEENLYTLGK